MKIIYMTRQIEKLHILYVKLHILHLKCLIQNSYKIIIYLITHVVQKFGIGKIFMCFKEVSYAHQGCINLIKNTDI